MATLAESASWTAGIYQLETTDPVLGGPDGIDNRQAKELANRTLWLRQQVEMATDGLAAHLAEPDSHSQYALKVSPEFSGIPRAPTPPAGTNTTQIATAAFVQAALAGLVDSSPATLDTLKELATALGDDPNFATTMAAALGYKAPLFSPALTGAPTAPTAALGTKTTQLATTEFVDSTLKAAITMKLQVFTVSDTFVAPAQGWYYISGCGGGGDGYNSSTAGGGGSGGQALDYPVFLEKDEVVPVTIAAKGGTTTFGSYLTLTGGVSSTSGDGGPGGTGPINGQRGSYRSSSNIGGAGADSFFGIGGPMAGSGEPRPSAVGYGAGGGGHNGSPGFGGPGLIKVRW